MQPVSERVALWERRLLEERTAEILGRMRRRRLDSVREAEESAAERERLWQEQGKPNHFLPYEPFSLSVNLEEKIIHGFHRALGTSEVTAEHN